MKIKVTVQQVRCVGVTHPKTQTDQIFVAYTFSVAKTVANKAEMAFAGGKVSPVQTGVRPTMAWQPSAGMSSIIDMESANFGLLSIALYEKDSGAIHQSLQGSLKDGIFEPPKFDWKEVAFPDDPSNWQSWLKAFWKTAVAAYKHFREDDYLGRHDIAIALESDEQWQGTREFKFKRFGGDYRVAVILEQA